MGYLPVKMISKKKKIIIIMEKMTEKKTRSCKKIPKFHCIAKT